MRVVAAPDSFKESMTARQAALAMERGVHTALPRAQVCCVPMSDGGEGFVDAVTSAWGARTVEASSTDALGRPVRARYGLAGERAVMDVASCAGLELVAPDDRDVMASTTAGLGLLVRDALSRGVRRILLGIGGSATNDCGMGMLTALGARLLDSQGREVAPACPSLLGAVDSSDLSGLDPALAGTQIEAACDVTNPLTGPCGATAVFGPQKGVREAQVAELDAVLGHLAEVTGQQQVAREAGAGAAGGLGFALRAFLGARLVPGTELVARAVGLEEAVRGADLVLTGEGSVDAQTAAGKTPAGVAQVARAAGVPCVVFAGRIRPGAGALEEMGARLVPIVDETVAVEQALREGPENLARAVARYLEALRADR
ncbi:glycerate kinase [Actinomyces faecalis]|uniref:glycerate kinase family protein n=1 Tax=Actinomyces faecalis TaxID=2722820 RepID=UPI001555B1B6|nr:glycerate kinase [Actinomyces faecalis]